MEISKLHLKIIKPNPSPKLYALTRSEPDPKPDTLLDLLVSGQVAILPLLFVMWLFKHGYNQTVFHDWTGQSIPLYQNGRILESLAITHVKAN